MSNYNMEMLCVSSYFCVMLGCVSGRLYRNFTWENIDNLNLIWYNEVSLEGEE